MPPTISPAPWVLRSGPHRCTSPDSPPRFPAPGKTRPDRHSGRLPRPLTPPRTRRSEQRKVRPPLPRAARVLFPPSDPPDRRLRTDRARRHLRCAPLPSPPPGRTEQRRRRLSVRPAPRVLPCSVSRPLNPSVRRCSPVRPSGHRGRRFPRSGPPRPFARICRFPTRNSCCCAISSICNVAFLLQKTANILWKTGSPTGSRN